MGMQSDTYLPRREELEQYFDRTAARTWEQLTSEAPVSRVRQTVRAGRDSMRACLLGWLPDDLTGKRVLDAGCGTGALAVAVAERGARVTAIDISASLIEVASTRTPESLERQIDYRVGDMLVAEPASYDHIVSMDSLIHYPATDISDALDALLRTAKGADSSLLFTFAPRTPLLMLMKQAGRLFPRGDRSPAIEPVAEARLRQLIAASESSRGVSIGRTHRVDTRFYKSQAMELVLP